MCMKVEVKLFATFREGRWKSKLIDFTDGTTIKDVLDYLEIDLDTLGIALINGRYSNVDEILKEEDVLALFPPVGGG